MSDSWLQFSRAYDRGFDVSGCVCVITGGASGIGRSLANKLAAKGARVLIIADIAEEDALETVSWLKITHPLTEFVYYYCDVSKDSNIYELIDTVKSKFGSIELFAANAGILDTVPVDLENYDETRFQKIFTVNTMHPIWSARKLVPYWLLRHRSDTSRNFCFITTASAAGLLTEAQRLPYTVSKYGAVSLAEFMAINYGPRGINSILVCPQAVSTKMTTGQIAGTAVIDGISSPEELAELILSAMESGSFFVCSPDKIKTYVQRKAANYDRWIKGMQRLRAKY